MLHALSFGQTDKGGQHFLHRGKSLTKGGEKAKEAQRGHPQVTNGVGDQHAATFQGGLEGDAFPHGGAHGTPARLDKGPPQDVVGHVRKPQRLDVVELAHIVQHHVLRQEVHRQAHCEQSTHKI